MAKLRRRQPARLSAIQDLAGARIIVPSLHLQDDLVGKLAARYPDATVDDKRTRPTFGYRAVHVIIQAPLPYEVQVRTEVQHTWAQLSERLADHYGFELKYGGGPPHIADALTEYANFASAVERLVDKREVELIGPIKGYLERLPAIVEALKVR